MSAFDCAEAENTDEPPKGHRRIKIDLTPKASAEVKRLCAKSGLSTANLFRYALQLARIEIEEQGTILGETND